MSDKLYVVIGRYYTATSFQGVFTSEEKAQEAVSELNRLHKQPSLSFSYEEVEVDQLDTDIMPLLWV